MLLRVPWIRPGETPESFAGRCSRVAWMCEQVAGKHPLIPPPAGTAWVRWEGLPWVPAFAARRLAGTSLARHLARKLLTAGQVWRLVGDLIRAVHEVEEQGHTALHLAPDQLLLDQTGRLQAVVGYSRWHSCLELNGRFGVVAVARLLHHVLLSFGQGTDIGDTHALWGIVARAYEGHYRLTGLSRMGEELANASGGLMHPLRTGAGRALLILDVDGVRAQTMGGLLRPDALVQATIGAGEYRLLPPVALSTHQPHPHLSELEHYGFEWRHVPAHSGETLGQVASALADRARADRVVLVAGGVNLEQVGRRLERPTRALTLVGFGCSGRHPAMKDGFQLLSRAIRLGNSQFREEKRAWK